MLYKHKKIMDFIELLIFLIFQIKTKSNKFNRNNEIVLFLRDYKTLLSY